MGPYYFGLWVWGHAFGSDVGLRMFSVVGSVVAIALACDLAWRWFGATAAVAVSAVTLANPFALRRLGDGTTTHRISPTTVIGLEQKARWRGGGGCTRRSCSCRSGASGVGNASCLAPAPHGFSDMPTNHFATTAISRLVEAGITGGTTPGHYSPNDKATRAPMPMFLHRDGTTTIRFAPTPVVGL